MDAVDRTLGALRDRQLKLVGRAASSIPREGPEADWLRAALRGQHGEDAVSFAATVLLRHGDFPRTYVDDLVAILVRKKADSFFARIRVGAVPILDALTRLSDRGALPAARRSLITYYLRARPGEDAAAVLAARERLRDSSSRAPDAAPDEGGAR